MKKFLIIASLSLLISSCSGGKVLDVKSPCVSNNDGPCGPRKPVNDWWLNKNTIKS